VAQCGDVDAWTRELVECAVAGGIGLFIGRERERSDTSDTRDGARDPFDDHLGVRNVPTRMLLKRFIKGKPF